MRARSRQRSARAFHGTSNAASEAGSATPTSGGGIMVASGHPSSHPQVLVVPLNRRPLMPGVIMPVRVLD